MDFALVARTFEALRITPPPRLILLEAQTLSFAHVAPSGLRARGEQALEERDTERRAEAAQERATQNSVLHDRAPRWR